MFRQHTLACTAVFLYLFEERFYKQGLVKHYVSVAVSGMVGAYLTAIGCRWNCRVRSADDGLLTSVLDVLKMYWQAISLL